MAKPTDSMTKDETIKQLKEIGFTAFEPLQKEQRDVKTRFYWTAPIKNHKEWFSVLIVEEQDLFIIEKINNPLSKSFEKTNVAGLLDYIRNEVFKTLDTET
jgi:hypothetical protein